MNDALLKNWGVDCLTFLESERKKFNSINTFEQNVFTRKKPIVKLPLQFTYLPVEILSKELTKFNSKYKERIIYLGPRWNDSLQWHKKFSNSHPTTQQQRKQSSQKKGYYFNQKQVTGSNSFIQDSMRQNRFFKNQVYYRAFEGMNPTLNDEELIFESRFESGNLDCVVKIRENQYDLFLRIDTNTRGNIFWYYFTLNLLAHSKLQTKKVKLNICNINKSKTLYEKNLKPYVKRIQIKDQIKDTHQCLIEDWTQGKGILNCKFRQKKLKYPFIYQKIKLSALYELSFEIQLKQNQQISLAYCIPYTYSYLMSRLYQLNREIESNKISNVTINKLGQSLTGVQIPMITIGNAKNYQNNQEKKVVFITARTHPGQSNSSLILHSLIDQLCLKKNKSNSFSKVFFIIVPMLNPDGVILGNGRCSALGKDLNRQFKSWNSFLNPEIVAVKRLIDKIQEDYEVEMYFDFHGHSKKKNIFFFGPSYPLMDPYYYRCRVFPKIFSKHLDFFRYYGCSYTISEGKNSTARAVMLNEFMIPFFYTVQTSVGFFHDYGQHKDIPFSLDSLSKIGVKFKESLRDYFEGIEEYESFLKFKKKEKTPKSQSTSLAPFKVSLEKQSETKLKDHQIKLSNLKIIKVFEEIKAESKKQQNIKKKTENSETDSDSCRASEDLELQKAKQFTQMLITFNKIELNKINLESKNFSSLDSQQQKIMRKKLIRKKSKNASELHDELNGLIKKLVTKNETEFRNPSNTKVDLNKLQRAKQLNFIPKLISPQEKKLILKSDQILSSNSSQIDTKEMNISDHNFYKKNEFFDLEQSAKLKFVNFSNAIQNPRSFRYYEDTKTNRFGSKSQNKRKVDANFKAEQDKDKYNKNNLSKFFVPFSEYDEDFLAISFKDHHIKASAESNRLSPPRPFPASFYRIKYQSSHRKYRNKSAYQMEQIGNKKQAISQIQQNKSEQTKRIQDCKEPQKLFITFNRVKGSI